MTTLEKLNDVDKMLNGTNGVSKTVCVNAAANIIRQIGETIVEYYLKEKGLWKDACTDKCGIVHTEEDYHPKYSYMVDIAFKKKVFKKDELHRFRSIQYFGNNGSHTGESTNNEDSIGGAVKWLETVFFVNRPKVLNVEEQIRDANAFLDGRIRDVSKTGRINAAANNVRQIGETIVEYYLKEKGFWKDACTEKNGKVHTEEDYHPNYGYMVFVADKKNVFKKNELEWLRVIQGYGNIGSHSGKSTINEYDIGGFSQWLREFFFRDRPESAMIDDVKNMSQSMPQPRQKQSSSQPKPQSQQHQLRAPDANQSQPKHKPQTRPQPKSPPLQRPLRNRVESENDLKPQSHSLIQSKSISSSCPQSQPKSFSNHSMRQPKQSEKSKKLNLTLIFIVLFGAFFLMILIIPFTINPSRGMDASGNIFSTRLFMLSHRPYNNTITYAKLFDFDKDGTDEVFYIYSEKGKTNNMFGIMKEGSDSTSLYSFDSIDLDISCGIYEYKEKYYIGMPYISSETNTTKCFAFVSVNSLLGITTETDRKFYLINDKSDSYLSQFNLIDQFPFASNKQDYSEFKSTVDSVKKQIRETYK